MFTVGTVSTKALGHVRLDPSLESGTEGCHEVTEAERPGHGFKV